MIREVRTDANVIEAAKFDIDWHGKILNNIMKLILKVSFTNMLEMVKIEVA
jgi:hypothetical protein